MHITRKDLTIIDCFLEIINKITFFQSSVILKLHMEFKVEKPEAEEVVFISQIEREGVNLFSEYIKSKIEINDCNILRQLILRIFPLVLSKKINLVVKCFKIYSNILPILSYLPLKKEEKANFSTEDPVNVVSNSALGPVMNETWEYLIFLIKEQGKNSITLTRNLIELLLNQCEYYVQFFNEGRIFTQFLPALYDNMNYILKEYAANQLETYLKLIFQFFDTVFKNNQVKNHVHITNLVKFFSFLIKEFKQEELNLYVKQSVENIIKSILLTNKLSNPHIFDNIVEEIKELNLNDGFWKK
jgi:hypothetical protein